MLFTPVTMLGDTIREHVQRPLLKLLQCYDALHRLRIALPVMSAQAEVYVSRCILSSASTDTVSPDGQALPRCTCSLVPLPPQRPKVDLCASVTSTPLQKSQYLNVHAHFLQPYIRTAPSNNAFLDLNSRSSDYLRNTQYGPLRSSLGSLGDS